MKPCGTCFATRKLSFRKVDPEFVLLKNRIREKHTVRFLLLIMVTDTIWKPQNYSSSQRSLIWILLFLMHPLTIRIRIRWIQSVSSDEQRTLPAVKGGTLLARSHFDHKVSTAHLFCRSSDTAPRNIYGKI